MKLKSGKGEINTEKNEIKWVMCPLCGAKTRLRLLRETELKAFPLFCPKCRRECNINAKNFIVEINKARR